MKTLVIVPTYNERENLPAFVDAVLAIESTADILIVDDNSPDGTGEIARKLSDTSSRVAVLHRLGKQGLGTAYIEGFRYALLHGYDCAVQMDADFSHRPQDLPAMLQAAASADVVIGSRLAPGGQVVDWPLRRRLLSRAGSLFARLVLSLPVRDCTSGFKCLRRPALQIAVLQDLRSTGYGFQIEVNHACVKAGLRVVLTAA